MEQFSIIANQVIILGILVIIGFVTSKFKVINTEVKNGIARLIIKITLPLLILTSISNVELTGEIIKDGISVFIFAYISMFLLFAFGVLSAKILKLKEPTKNVHMAHIMFGNVAFLGFPLFNALYPNGQGLFFAVIYQIVSDSLVWTLGVYLLSRHHGENKKSIFRHLINPNTTAFVIGIIMLITKIRIPGVVNEALSGLGHTTIYLSMVYIGATLASIDIKGIYKQYSVFILTVLKLLIVPLLYIYILKAVTIFTPINIGQIPKTVLVLQTAMPCMATIVVLAKDFNSDDVYATKCVFISTIFSLITLPVLFYLVQII